MISSEHFPFSVRPLPYPAKSLMPYLTARTLKIHHDGHYAAYIQRLNKILETYPQYQTLPLEALILKLAFIPEAIRSDIRTNVSGALNHMLYFECLTPPCQSKISAEFQKVICKYFSSTRNLIESLIQASLSVKGSGFAYLTSDTNGKLHIIVLKESETPLEYRLSPLLAIDMWEHAYYLQYQYHKKDYIHNLMHIINWNRIERNYFSS